jgi:hypothetical protein
MSPKQVRALVCHAQTPLENIEGIGVMVTRVSDDRLTLSYQLRGNLETVIIPDELYGESPQRPVDELWRHTCFEAFLMAGNGPGYQEYNFSPSREWASYTFSDYRQAHALQISKAEDEPTPVIRVHRDAQSLSLETEIPLLRQLSNRSLRLGLCAVVEATDGSLSYWALRHPPGKPDFHHVDAFDLQLDWPD